MRHFTIATAGHVDHGKSTLVRALTGINPDRLAEEQKREMTIDLGFAYMPLPNKHPTDKDIVGIIDVPGHIDFIENMLAGVGGIDAAMLVIAADEGPMPQTREHLAILDLLDVKRGIVALTKTDLAPDSDWVSLISEDVRRLLMHTPLKDAPIIPISARTKTNMQPLVTALQSMLQSLPPVIDDARPRLAVDRAFTIAGFGTVVTGTLLGGSLHIGDELEVMPAALRARVRGLQTHGKAVESAQPGSRVAVNLTGVSVNQVYRGCVMALPGSLRATMLIDARVEVRDYLASGRNSTASVIHHNQQVKLFVGASESMATFKLLDGASVLPGQTAWVQFEVATPLACARGDRFIVRLPSPSITLGGGQVADPNPTQRYRRKGGRVDDQVTERLSAALKGTPAERLQAALKPAHIVALAQLADLTGLTDVQQAEAIDSLLAAGIARELNGLLALDRTWDALGAQASQLLTGFHRSQPLAEGMPRDTLRSKLGLSPAGFVALLTMQHGAVIAESDWVRSSSHMVSFSLEQQRLVTGLLLVMRGQPWATPLVKDCVTQVGQPVYDVLVRRRTLVQVSPDVVFLAETFDAAVQKVRDLITQNGEITAAGVRDAFGTSRKYALALLEHLDSTDVTRRVGDARVLKTLGARPTAAPGIPRPI